MSKLINFDTYEYSDDNIPDHTQAAIENYLINGWSPGGFVSAMLAGDLFKAAMSADFANRTAWQCIANWIQHVAPLGSWGSYANVDMWMADVGGVRSNFVKKIEQGYIIKTLKE